MCKDRTHTHHTQMKACRTDNIQIRLVNCVKVNFPVVLLCYAYRCYHWGIMDERYGNIPVLILTTAHESTMISKLVFKTIHSCGHLSICTYTYDTFC